MSDVKRVIDVLGSLMAMLLLAPVYMVICFVLVLDMGWPLLKKTRCPGQHERPFDLWRFKTVSHVMVDGVFVRKQTRVGTYLKQTKLDRLPQLFNVLKGDMSLVGPRPQAIRTISMNLNESLKRRHHVKPGIMGWAQLHYHRELSQKQIFELDQYYIKHQSIWLDLKIMGATLIQAVRYVTRKR